MKSLASSTLHSGKRELQPYLFSWLCPLSLRDSPLVSIRPVQEMETASGSREGVWFCFHGQHSLLSSASVSMWVRAGCNLRPRIKLPPGWVLLISVNLSEATLDKPGGGVGVDATGSLERRSIPGLEIRALGGPKEARACSLRPHTPLRCSAWHLRFDASQTYDQCLSSPVREMEK